ncbi:DUF4176 domain-containing protein [Salicibibacter cibarius]|uniref:DUF4176 domain-containing protein n=1 Tax=Salicibibacter cibarius TaxID=2743000 RepID=A0A7T6Z630_9BACI|nr:DUF4176 domain-containing protein [Salicibibacter cibarius]QQK77574.1 DUF4176 domain-containing protein [Salicibibacter cibarius]
MNQEDHINSLQLPKSKTLLPIGTVVEVNFVKQAIMIYGRKQRNIDQDNKWDYVACPYPQGHISNDTNVFFNHDQITRVIFKGLETEGELELRNILTEEEDPKT